VATIAVIFDFDDTLVPDSTTKLLSTYGVDPNEFWGLHAEALIERGFDPPLAYLNLLLQRVGPGKPFGELTNADLASFGASLDDDFYQGVPEIFDDLKATAKEINRDLSVEFYIITGGLEEVVTGSSTVREHFEAVYGCRLEPQDDTGTLRQIARCVTFTEKTRYIFEINKGITREVSLSKPYEVTGQLIAPPGACRLRT